MMIQWWLLGGLLLLLSATGMAQEPAATFSDTFRFDFRVEAVPLQGNRPNELLYAGTVKKQGTNFCTEMNGTVRLFNATCQLTVDHTSEQITYQPPVDPESWKALQAEVLPDSTWWSRPGVRKQQAQDGGWTYYLDRPSPEYKRVTAHYSSEGFIRQMIYDLLPTRGSTYRQIIATYSPVEWSPEFAKDAFSERAYVRHGKPTKNYAHYQFIPQ